MKKLLPFLLFFGLLSLTACGKTPSAVSAMDSFRDAFGGGGILFSPTVLEGEDGYIGTDWLVAFFGESAADAENPLPADYAVLLFPSLAGAREAGVFVCDDTGDALRLCELCLDRLELLRSVARAGGTPVPDGAFVRRYGKTVVYAVVEDAERAEAVFSRLF